MKQRFIALAFAGLISSPLMAQSNISLYGVVDANMSYAKIGDNRFRGVQSGGLSASRIGVRGTEDLGNGLKALFTVEYGINSDLGDGITGARQSFVGLEGGFGFVGLGRQYSPGHNISGAIDPFASSAALSPVLLAQGVDYQGGFWPDSTAATIQGGGGGRFSNAISYKSPSYRGLKVEALYAFGENADQSNAQRNRNAGNLLGIGGQYRSGPLTLGLVYHQREGTRFTDMGLQVKQRDKKEWFMGGRYDFGIAEVAASWQQIKSGVGVSGFGSETWRDRIWQLSGIVPITEAGNILAGYAELDAAFTVEDVKVWTLAYTHSLSKRTTAYAGYRHVNNNSAASTVALPGLRANDQLGNSSQGLVIGVRHSF